MDVLLVEDNLEFRAFLREELSVRFPSIAIKEAGDGEEAMQKLDGFKPRLVLMDIGLPGISGIEATRQLKLLAPKLPVVILSVYGGDSYRADAQEAGAVAYVQKRELQKELLPALSKLISSVEDRPNGPLQQSAEEG